MPDSRTTLQDHTSKRFDQELESLRTRVLHMGGLVEHQVSRAMDGLYSGDLRELDTVVQADLEINRLEVELDESCSQVIAKRQPTAIDLRMVMTVLKSVADLERIGDKARKIALLATHLHTQKGGVMPEVDLRPMAEQSLKMLRTALDAFARLDTVAAAEVVHFDETVNSQYGATVRQLITFMMEDPRTISHALDILTIAKAVERVGDLSKGIAEHVVYMVRGVNVRHVTVQELDQTVKGN